MFAVKLDVGEKIITVQYPPKRAAYYYFIKNSPIKLILLLIFVYYLGESVYSSMFGPVEVVPQTAAVTNVIKNNAQTQDNPASSSPNKTADSGGVSSQTWHFSYEFHGSISNINPYFFGVLSVFIFIYFCSQIKKQRALLASTSYTITNKRIIVQSAFPKQNIQLVNYSDQKYCSVLQTPFHRLLNIYFICFSSNPIAASWLNATNQLSTAANDIVDILTQEQANQLVELFKNKEFGEISTNTQEFTVNTTADVLNRALPTDKDFNERVVIKHDPRYMLLLLPKFFVLYGFWYALAVVILFFGQLYEFGLFSLFISWDNSIKFLLVYVLFFMVIAYFRSLYQIKNNEYVFTKSELILPQRLKLFISNKSIPYQDISNLNVAYSRFNLYQVNFTANLKQKVWGAGNEVQTTQIKLSIPGLSKENSERVPLLIQK